MSSLDVLSSMVPGINLEGFTIGPRGSCVGVRKSIWGSRCAEPYAESVEREIKYGNPVLKEAAERIKGQVLVDLGSGHMPIGVGMAQRWGAAGYIGVDLYYGDMLQGHLNWERSGLKLPRVSVKESMDDFLARLPDGSVSVFASGLEVGIVDRTVLMLSAPQVTRVLSPQGAFLSYQSDLYPARPNWTESSPMRLGWK